MEDHYGDMDFKVAGTRNGITALQMDIKVTGISEEILREALAQAHKGRMEILDNMETAISAPRDHVSEWAPKMAQMMIPVEKIRIVIGKGGEQIDKIIAACDGIKIDITDDGKCVFYHTKQDMIDKAMQIVGDLIREAKVGDIYDATVSEVRESFAFVTLFPGTDALLHVSELAWTRVEKIQDALHVGDVIKVKVTGVDPTGKVKVSAKECLEKPEGYVEPKKNFKPQGKPNFHEKREGANVERRVFKKKENAE